MKNQKVLLIALIVCFSVLSVTVLPTVANYGEVRSFNRSNGYKRFFEVYWDRAITMWTTSWWYTPEGGPQAWVASFDGSDALAVGSWGETWVPPDVYTQTDMVEIIKNYHAFVIVDGTYLEMDTSPPRKWKESEEAYGWTFRVGLSYKPGAFIEEFGAGIHTISWEIYLYGELIFDTKPWFAPVIFYLY